MLISSWLRSLKFPSRLIRKSRNRKRQSIPLFAIERLEDRTLLSFFAGLGTLEDGSQTANAFDVSFDGSVVVGHVLKPNGDQEAYRWENGTLQLLGDFPGGSNLSVAFAVSADGSVVAGFSSAQLPSGSDDGFRSFRWTTQTNQIAELPDPTGVGLKSATGISADGSVIVGGTFSRQSFVWTETTGAMIIGPHGSPRVSSDGTVVASGGVSGYRWTEATGRVSIGQGNSPAGVSADGSVIVGDSPAFRWTAETQQAVNLGFTSAAAVSDDGRIVVGQNFTGSGNDPTSQQAIIWDEVNGPRDLKEVLEGLGLDLSGWILQNARAISGDGQTIAGPGINPLGQQEAWIANLVPVQQVQIDIKPEELPNEINLNSNGFVSVAVLTTEEFDAATVDTSDFSRIKFGDVNLTARVSPVASALEDVDQDGDTDLVLRFSIPEINESGALIAESTTAELTGFTIDGRAFLGTDSLEIVGPSYNQLVLDVDFQVLDHSMWGPGEAFDFIESGFFGLEWDESGGIRFDGIGVSGSTNGRIGLEHSFTVTSGFVDLRLPGRITISYPEFASGNMIAITSSFLPDPSALMQTSSPQATAKLDLPFKVATEVDSTLLPAPRSLIDFDQTLPLFDIEPGDFAFMQDFGDFGSISAHIPIIDTSDDFSDRIFSSSGSDDFIELELDVDKIATTLFRGAGIPVPDLGGSLDFLGLVTFNYDLLDLTATATAGFMQSFTFDPGLKVKYELENGLTFVGNVGETIRIHVPDNVGDSLEITPTFFLDNIFTNTTELILKPGISLSALSADVSFVRLDRKFGPLFEKAVETTIAFDVFSNTFALEGFQEFTASLIKIPIKHPGGGALHISGQETDSVIISGVITQIAFQPIVNQAISLWSIAGMMPDSLDTLRDVEVHIADLSGSLLGLAAAHSIWIDQDAAGYGWSVNISDNGLIGRVDLLSVVTHEIGHLLGFEHTKGGVMAETLAVGERRLPGNADALADKPPVATGPPMASESSVFVVDSSEFEIDIDHDDDGVVSDPRPIHSTVAPLFAESNDDALTNESISDRTLDNSANSEPLAYLPEDELDADGFFSNFDGNLLDDLLAI